VTAVRPVVVRQAHIRRRRLRRRQRDNQSCERKQTNAQHSPSEHRTPLLPYSPPKRGSRWRTLRPPSTAGRTLVKGLKPAAASAERLLLCREFVQVGREDVIIARARVLHHARLGVPMSLFGGTATPGSSS